MEGTVVRAVNSFFYVREGDSIRQCRARGVFRKRGIYVLVGDRVEYEAVGDEGVIEAVLPRRTELYRPPIANVDQALLVFSVRTPDFLPHLLDRMLVAVVHAGLTPVIVLSKADLISEDELANLAAPYRTAGYSVLAVTRERMESYEPVLACLRGRVTVLAGPSGAGKSTLANTLSPELGLKMGSVSEKLGHGRHTTRHVELFAIDGETFVADAPGFSQLELNMKSEDVRLYFPEFQEAATHCGYRGCVHVDETACAVKAALAEGVISQTRYQSYKAVVEELREREAHQY